MTFSLLKTLSSLFFRPSLLQVGALCCRDTGSDPEVLLIRSLDSNRWIIPKGWPMRGKTLAEAAAIEAYEEAGIIGKVAKEPIGEFASHKGLGNGLKVRTNVIVYPLAVDDQVSDYPETGQRDLLWMPLEEAALRCEDDGLRQLLKSRQVKSLLMDNK